MTEVNLNDWNCEPLDRRLCKHGVETCTVCGISKRDATHTTKNGKGVVARLRKLKAPGTNQPATETDD